MKNMKNIISLSGLIGSGKDLMGEYLNKKYGFEQFSFAGNLKDIISILFGWDRYLLEGKTEESRNFRETVDEWWSEKLKIENFTPRKAMQLLGTELFRKNFNQQIWIFSLIKKLEKTNTNNSKYVITDCRFLSEYNFLKEINCFFVLIERPPLPVWYEELMKINSVYENKIENKEKNKREKEIIQKYNIHESEAQITKIKYDYIIKNDGTKEDFFKKIDDFYFFYSKNNKMNSND